MLVGSHAARWRRNTHRWKSRRWLLYGAVSTLYIYGHPFTLVTDHKALENLWKYSRSKLTHQDWETRSETLKWFTGNEPTTQVITGPSPYLWHVNFIAIQATLKAMTLTNPSRGQCTHQTLYMAQNCPFTTCRHIKAVQTNSQWTNNITAIRHCSARNQ